MAGLEDWKALTTIIWSVICTEDNSTMGRIYADLDAGGDFFCAGSC